MDPSRIDMSRGESFFDYFKAHAHLTKTENIHYADSVPVEMMKMTQSLSRVQKIASSSFTKRGQATALGDYVSEKTYILYDPVKKVHRRANAAAAMKAGTYFRRVLEKIIQENEASQPTPSSEPNAHTQK